MKSLCCFLGTLFIFALPVVAQEERKAAPPPESLLPKLTLPSAGGSYLDPITHNRVWRVTDSRMCSRGAQHYYSYWPVWNADGSYLMVECLEQLGGQKTSTVLLMRDSDLKPAGDALRGAPSFTRGRLFWSWKDPHVFYAYVGSELWKWDPFDHRGNKIHNFGDVQVSGMKILTARLAYVSFDDRYLLVELLGPNLKRQKNSPWDTLALVTYDMQLGRIAGLLDITDWPYYDEAVFAKDNSIWLRMTDATNTPQSYDYSLDFEKRVRVAEGGHYGLGLTPNGSPIVVKEAGNRDCAPGSLSGNPRDKEYPAKGWKPTAVLLDPLVDTTGAERNGPIASLLYKLGCNVPGQHEFAHFSWNNSQNDYFFAETWGYSPAGTDPISNSIIRVRLRFDSRGKVRGDEIDVLANHRSSKKLGYWATPRVCCNQQGTRCLFSSVMVEAVENSDRLPHLYIVDVPRP